MPIPGDGRAFEPIADRRRPERATALPAARAGAFTANDGPIRTVPVNHPAGPFPEGRKPARPMSIGVLPSFRLAYVQFRT
jgi:hypothetical protein